MWSKLFNFKSFREFFERFKLINLDNTCIVLNFYFRIFLRVCMISIFDNIFSSSNFWIFNQNSIFTKLLICDKNLNFWQKIATFFFYQSFDFFTKFLICDQNLNFWQKLRLMIKISILYEIFDLWPTFKFLTKIPTCDQNCTFSTFPNFFWSLI